jgi:hypothetical protein
MVITLNKKKCLKILNENREKHIKAYTEQIQGWKKAMDQYSEELAAWSSKASEDIFNKENAADRPKEPYKPQSYLPSYDRLIELISNNVTETIEVSENDFDQIVNDEFGWTHTFLTTNSLYNSK